MRAKRELGIDITKGELGPLEGVAADMEKTGQLIWFYLDKNNMPQGMDEMRFFERLDHVTIMEAFNAVTTSVIDFFQGDRAAKAASDLLRHKTHEAENKAISILKSNAMNSLGSSGWTPQP